MCEDVKSYVIASGVKQANAYIWQPFSAAPSVRNREIKPVLEEMDWGVLWYSPEKLLQEIDYRCEASLQLISLLKDIAALKETVNFSIRAKRKSEKVSVQSDKCRLFRLPILPFWFVFAIHFKLLNKPALIPFFSIAELKISINISTGQKFFLSCQKILLSWASWSIFEKAELRAPSKKLSCIKSSLSLWNMLLCWRDLIRVFFCS